MLYMACMQAGQQKLCETAAQMRFFCFAPPQQESRAARGEKQGVPGCPLHHENKCASKSKEGGLPPLCILIAAMGQ